MTCCDSCDNAHLPFYSINFSNQYTQDPESGSLEINS